MAITIQDVFNRMMVLHNNLALLSGGDDVARGLAALNMAEDWFELEAAKYSGFMRYPSEFATTASDPRTYWPETLLRLDSLWLLDGALGQPIRELETIDSVNGQVGGPFSEMTLGVATSFGPPQGYYADGWGGYIYWSPVPDAIYYVRAHGMFANPTQYTAAGDTFGWNDHVAVPLVPVAVQLMLVGHGRKLGDVQAEAGRSFKAFIEGLRRTDRSMPETAYYSEEHTT